MVVTLIILTVIISILMIFIVLMQNPKGSGISSQFGGAGATQMLGAKSSTNIFEKITWGMATAVFVLCIVANLLLENPANQSSGYISPNEKAARDAVPVNLEELTPAEKEELEQDSKPAENQLPSEDE
ncbi:MAG: preprotein translocase subunit SecG [Bernardetiaceae bacterium]|nr:preprotein translocase subunit SecG [Bernardetiaceae bacterium]